ncbi:hypothetical protein ACLPJG_27060 [Pseudomonas aeruginosa]|jgi:hypothetical protein|uniref:Uncharacterized protein n=3 Tax=Pseudomonas TaxID=286 RepID=A0A3M4JWD9_9PSED|nr:MULTISPECIES: hypothetical protein [Pseudomonas]KXK67397.1 hypothetical protein BC89_32085 [Pseudomonas monteilii]TXG96988.1 MAG: hypothetical protein E6R08_08120 [Nevskiaceae bacterium]AGZ38080.1 hypothetical protein PVLB_26717 [Pseudomonas sp. VLB120]MCT8191210.1 hypothetical protein [Pseudomonas monteilii]MDH0760424.1 hypothetical protein [Pseudomonas juntendi]
MRALEEIVIEFFQGWDGKHISEPAFGALGELAKDGRFDEMTALLEACVKRHGRFAMGYVLKHVPGVLLNNYVYGQVEASATIVENYWRDEDVATTIRDAALKPGKLSVVVPRILSDLREMAESSR